VLALAKGTHSNEITAFTIGSDIFRVIGTNHALEMLQERNLDPFYVASACLALGQKLGDYNDSDKKVMIKDEGRSLACLIAVESYTIVLITVIDRADVFAKNNTEVEELSAKFGA
jgi:putative NADH-flavin reductase